MPPEFTAKLNRLVAVQVDKEFQAELEPGKAHRADLVFQVSNNRSNKPSLIHIEIESSHQKTLPGRMLHYYASLHKKYKMPILPIAILSFKSPRKAASSRIELCSNGISLGYFQFLVVQLNMMNWQSFLKIRNPVASALMSCMWFTETQRPEVKLKCLLHLADLSLPPNKSAVVQKFIHAYLDLSTSEKKRFEEMVNYLRPFERDTIMTFITGWHKEGIEIGRAEGLAEGLAKGLAEGMAEGLAEGMAEGLAEGLTLEAQNIVKRFAVRKFGSINQELTNRINTLSKEYLEQLAEDFLDFSTIEDLETWLLKIQPGDSK